ncbi:MULTISPECIES: cbb3-type cytochrome c oxidase N-terminal domain-containing protein [Flavobacterium]|uniref:Cbb3-type cytochrome c oxidase N-terminal domain-containing protein n=1 Tax=Flavobacterium covae TaxID=2906076 RepID=A0ABW8PHJ7_9FLAO|nr:MULTISPECIES: cbb3-type cytochrome c oxidase N-terminal domain-containing protein [Flavobacterium]OXA78985.1 cytochrome C oxidase subunit III [Flavobacterium columnare NBRC 100251 = ATCC 23463]AMA49190.1 cytochrome C oxidase subunit III [Flavobacterium covae]MCJ1806296.1 c-type cytochrome [Flavobacterium covae]MCJ1809716.1 c-type cytochrome [Flavobacterium covae]OWP80539.1 cytochrome C oxidase subunit III [Flavobacterium covae]
MKKIFPIYVRIPVFFGIFFIAMEFFIDSGDRPAFIKYPILNVILLIFLLILIAVELVLNATDKVLDTLLTDEQRKAKELEESLPFTETQFFKGILQKLTRSRKVEEENELIMNHNYDGIQELDNVLPPWWVYLFYGTIAFAFIYLVRFHMLGHDDQTAEFEKEMAIAKVQVEEYKKTAPDLMDKETVTLLTDSESINAGKAIFQTNCIACHKADAGGAIGPNLTDQYWVLGGGIKNVFNTIMEGGRAGKGMIAWKDQIKPSEIQKIASYVLSLQGTNPAGAKAPEGDLWEEGGVTKAAETTSVNVDSTKAK